MRYFLMGCAFWGAGALALYAVRPNSRLAALPVQTMGRREKIILSAVLTVTILLCTLPMSLSPAWNGEDPAHRNQYEVMAESVLNGHVYLDYDDVDPRLLELENPYDPDLRVESGVSFRWDHALYNGHYYMYFGVVPVFLLFLPFRIITGTALTTYHATQIFTAIFIAGIFILFRFLAKKFLPALSWGVYFPLSVAFSAMSVWYAVGCPALYCTAITAALCMEIWSIYFFMKAAWDSPNDWRAVLYGTLGSLLGALAFGCRPTIALTNLLAIPLFFHYVRGKKWGLKLVRQIVIVLLPYVVVGGLLMAYNYVRFDNPFEFGQTYQLTTADQSGYGSFLSQLDLAKIGAGIKMNFLRGIIFDRTRTHITFDSVLINFPVCILGLVLLLRKKTFQFLKENRLRAFMILLVCLPVLTTGMEVMMTPYLLERYRMDIYWLMGLLCFLSFGIVCQTSGGRQKYWGFLFAVCSYITILSAFMFWMIPYDMNYTQMFPEALKQLVGMVTFGFLQL